MGYYSYFSLNIGKLNEEKTIEILEKNKFVYSIIQHLRDANTIAADSFDDEGNCLNENRWYSYKEEIAEFSKKYPDFFFVIEREGEGNTDIEIDYIKDGKYQECPAKIIFEPFNPLIFEL